MKNYHQVLETFKLSQWIAERQFSTFEKKESDKLDLKEIFEKSDMYW